MSDVQDRTDEMYRCLKDIIERREQLDVHINLQWAQRLVDEYEVDA